MPYASWGSSGRWSTSRRSDARNGKGSRSLRSTVGFISGFQIAAPQIQSRKAVMVLVIDNYDSFTYNLVQYLGELNVELEVHRNDQITLDQIRKLKPDRILVSPGPCSPRES